MSNQPTLHLPSYTLFIDSIKALALPISGSELHGQMCGYLCAGAIKEGENYLRALMGKIDNKDSTLRTAALALFGVYAVSQQQMTSFNFDFQLLLPEEETSLAVRAQAFSEWCEGFTQGITLAGVDYEQLEEEDAQEALQHLTEFGQLDYEHLDFGENDERALMEISEYTRLAVLRLYNDLNPGQTSSGKSTAH